MGEKLREFISDMVMKVYKEIEPKTKVRYHARLQKALVNSAVYFNLKGVSEYKVVYGERKGQIDIVWLDSDSSPAIAIEIDSSLRKKSIMKLLVSNAMQKVQVFYGDKPEEVIQNFLNTYDVEKEVIFIHVPLRLLRNKEVQDQEQPSLFSDY